VTLDGIDPSIGLQSGKYVVPSSVFLERGDVDSKE